ncbi:MAG: Dyp-type peroxidase [Thermomicrobiales bacterium]|nr:Dyp-type peroxidase [Thermomicrobiales bacterium]MCO5225270.1 Dyp-type peroxidase [Thermomicrobiales bacterium]
MRFPQAGIFAVGTPENDYLELDLLPGADLASLVKALVNLGSFRTEIGVNIVLAFKPSLWRYLHPDDLPVDAADWQEPIVGADGFTMPTTPHDAWVWVSGPDRATVFDTILEIRNVIDKIASVATEVTGWHYREGRDLTGFIDGTENPQLIQAPAIATVPADQPGAGSCILIFQKWRHDIAAWTGLTTKAQEDVIGRSKADSVEIPDDVKPPTSHVARTTVDRDGEEPKIFRHNVAYGDTGEHGTLFVGFSCDQWRQMEMLRRMAGVDGIRDALTRFTTPVSGAAYVVPSTSVLALYVQDDDD